MIPDMPDYGWPAVIVTLVTFIGLIITAVREKRGRRREKMNEAEQERRADAAAGDVDLESLDCERARRLHK